MIGCSPSLSVATASRSIRFAMSAFGERDKVQETTIPSKQSTTGESQHLYPSMVNWVTSVTHSMFGASAWKSRSTSVLLQCLFDRFGSVFPQCGLMVFPGVVIVSR